MNSIQLIANGKTIVRNKSFDQSNYSKPAKINQY